MVSYYDHQEQYVCNGVKKVPAEKKQATDLCECGAPPIAT